MFVFIMLGTLVILCLADGAGHSPRILSYPEFWHMAEAGAVQSVRIGNGENWHVTLSDGQGAITPNPRALDGKERLLAMNVQVIEQQESAVPPLVFMGLLLGMFFVMIRNRSKGTSMGLQKYASIQADERIPEITLNDVAVARETLQSMRDLVDFLQKPDHFSKYGARIPKGVMLYGPPGTGKTLLAKALAGEAKAPFFAMSGADFVQVYVGVGASRIRELFKKARKAGGGVIFIDEIDAIGKKRDNGNDEREQTLNALLTEMSGF